MRWVFLMTAILCAGVCLCSAGVCAASTWYIQTVDSTGDAGRWSSCRSLALDASGHPHISYGETINDHLKYAAWNGSSWVIQTVDSAGYVGMESSLALDASGRPRISYFDGGYELKYAGWNGSSWAIVTVDSSVPAWPTSLALDASGDPRISYQGGLGIYELRYAAWNGAAWVTETVDSPGNVGQYSCLALDASGRPHISYFDLSNGDLKYAAWSGSSWAIQIVDSVGRVGHCNALALDANGYPRISYHDASNGDLKYAAWNGSTWVIQTVDSTGDVGTYTSLALDPDGFAHISYYDATNGDLKYAAWNGTSWDIETVDSAGAVGQYTSLALDANRFAHIGYYDYTNGDLKYATTRPPTASHELPATGYYMISLPLTPGSATAHDVLCDDLGCGSYYMWGWQGGGYHMMPTSPPGCQGAALSMQEGYWLLSAAATLHIVGTAPSGDQAIPLQAGWNMVAAPYEATMDSLLVDNAGDVRSLAEAQAAGWVLATFYYSHDGSGSYRTLTIGQTPPDELSVWYGYWVLAGLDCLLIVPEPSGGSGATTMRTADQALAQPVWAFDIQVRGQGSADSITIAAADSASEDFDGFALDRPKPPTPPGASRLRMALGVVGRGCPSPPAPATSLSPAASELGMETKGATQEVEWHFTVTGGVKGEPVTLTWPELSGLPKDRVAILTDRDTGKRTFMRTRGQYEFAAPGEGASRNFGVTVKPAQQAGALINSFLAVPVRGGGAELAFSLSADAAVSIDVVNVAGRLVQRIRDGLQAEAGRHTVAWRGRSISDTALPNGLYLCVLSAKASDGQQARAVRPIRLAR